MEPTSTHSSLFVFVQSLSPHWRWSWGKWSPWGLTHCNERSVPLLMSSTEQKLWVGIRKLPVVVHLLQHFYVTFKPKAYVRFLENFNQHISIFVNVNVSLWMILNGISPFLHSDSSPSSSASASGCSSPNDSLISDNGSLSLTAEVNLLIMSQL